MHSLKNTIIAVGLLGLSFVFYQMSSPDQSNFEEIAPPVITDLHVADAGSAGHVKLPSLNSSRPPGNEIGLRNPLASRNSSKPSDFKPPSPKITNPNPLAAPELSPPKLAPPKLTQPKLTQPKLTPPTPTQTTEQPEFKPRPEAKFDLTGNSGRALTPAEEWQSMGVLNFEMEAATPNEAQQRDQGLIAALKKQQVADGSQSKAANQFKANAFVPKPKTPAETASFVRDSAVVAASSTGGDDASNKFQLQPAKSATTNDPYADLNFQTVWPVADALVEEKRFRKTLELLTRFNDSPGLSGPQQQRLYGWLDALATKVVFSSEPHLAPAYISKPGDTLLELGREWGVPGQLIFNVNKRKILGISDNNEMVPAIWPPRTNNVNIDNIPAPKVIPPGTELKKITGPINARVDLKNNTMTLFVDGLYAGRYNVIVGVSGSPRPGDFKAVVKSASGHEWKDVNGSYPPGHPNNHYGKHWIGMEGHLCMHSVPANTQDGHLGCLGLSEKDAEDVFSILSEGSTISIQ